MSISGIGGGLGGLSLLGFKPAGEIKGGAADIFAGETTELKRTAEEDFLDYARMSVAERIRAQVLQEEKLTEEKLAELDAKQREAVEERIREKIAEKITGETGKEVGSIADLTV